MPAGAIYVGRPTEWGNPWRGNRDVAPMIGRGPHGLILVRANTVQEAVDLYRERLVRLQARKWIDLSPLRGKDLACWCSLDRPCHADVLLEMANTR